MHEAILSQIVCQRLVARELAQEVSNLRLVPPNQFAVGRCVLARHHARDK
jgi:hypothetical protein